MTRITTNSSYKTLVLGASTNPGRFSYLAIKSLVGKNVEVVAIGSREGEVEGIPITTARHKHNDIHTITLYLNPSNQVDYLDYILSLNPKRIIFNPGTENGELLKLARSHGIEVVFDCTLVMLKNGRYFQ